MKKINKKHRSENLGEILTVKQPFIYTEAYKALRTNIEFLSVSNSTKKILVASSLSGEGKTCLSINLAISLAQTGKKVIILDCDLRKPKIHKYLRIKHSNHFGVSNVLSGSCDIDKAIGYLEESNLYVMLAGPTPPNPSELLQSKAAEEMLDKLAERFDYIICDTAPIAIVTDAVALSAHCDGVLFVIRQNYATVEQVSGVIDKLRSVNAKILGTVLNSYDAANDSSSYYGQYYYYYSSKHYEYTDDQQ